jgi:hypothetical protein
MAAVSLLYLLLDGDGSEVFVCSVVVKYSVLPFLISSGIHVIASCELFLVIFVLPFVVMVLIKDTQVCFPVALVGNDFSSASVRQDVAQGHLIQ